MISPCHTCNRHVQVALHPSGTYQCREHYLEASELIRQNRDAALVSQNELRALGLGCRRKQQVPVIEERRADMVMHGECD